MPVGDVQPARTFAHVLRPSKVDARRGVAVLKTRCRKTRCRMDIPLSPCDVLQDGRAAVRDGKVIEPITGVAA